MSNINEINRLLRLQHQTNKLNKNGQENIQQSSKTENQSTETQTEKTSSEHEMLLDNMEYLALRGRSSTQRRTPVIKQGKIQPNNEIKFAIKRKPKVENTSANSASTEIENAKNTFTTGVNNINSKAENLVNSYNSSQRKLITSASQEAAENFNSIINSIPVDEIINKYKQDSSKEKEIEIYENYQNVKSDVLNCEYQPDIGFQCTINGTTYNFDYSIENGNLTETISFELNGRNIALTRKNKANFHLGLKNPSANEEGDLYFDKDGNNSTFNYQNNNFKINYTDENNIYVYKKEGNKTTTAEIKKGNTGYKLDSYNVIVNDEMDYPISYEGYRKEILIVIQKENVNLENLAIKLGIPEYIIEKGDDAIYEYAQENQITLNYNQQEDDLTDENYADFRQELTLEEVYRSPKITYARLELTDTSITVSTNAEGMPVEIYTSSNTSGNNISKYTYNQEDNTVILNMIDFNTNNMSIEQTIKNGEFSLDSTPVQKIFNISLESITADSLKDLISIGNSNYSIGVQGGATNSNKGWWGGINLNFKF